jgi:hypothetical protein
VHEAVEQGALPARLLRGVADDDEAAWQDLDGGRANAEQAWRTARHSSTGTSLTRSTPLNMKIVPHPIGRPRPQMDLEWGCWPLGGGPLRSC